MSNDVSHETWFAPRTNTYSSTPDQFALPIENHWRRPFSTIHYGLIEIVIRFDKPVARCDSLFVVDFDIPFWRFDIRPLFDVIST